MCGIFLIFDKKKPVDIHTAARSLDKMEHRGPDDSGYQVFSNGQLFLGHRRLSIIDPTNNAKQPFSNEQSSLIFNGEIYNFKELSQTHLGQEITPKSDTVVLASLLQKYAEGAFPALNGMWGLVYYDCQKETLLISRDRFGKKPLYYFEDSNVFIVSSEIKPILSSGYYRTVENRFAVEEYLNTGQVDGLPETFFKNIYRFPSSSYALYDIRTQKRTEPVKYYEISTKISQKRKTLSKTDLLSEFQEILRDSVSLRLRSDVPIGVCLSGGLDSSTLYGLVHESTTTELHSFSAVFPDPECDESLYIDSITQKYLGKNHKVDPSTTHFRNELKTIIHYLEEPSKAPGVFPQWSVFKLASKNVTVVIDGQGGDELLAGYDQYTGFYLADLLLNNPYSFMSSLHSIHKSKGLRYSLSAIKGMIAALLKNKFMPAESYLKRKLKKDIETEILPALLRYEDKLGMAHSIEARMPFLDYRLVDFVFSLDPQYLIKDGILKHFLREAMSDVLPDLIRNRTDKKGFPTPVRRMYNDDFGFAEGGKLQFRSDTQLWRELSVKIWREEFNV